MRRSEKINKRSDEKHHEIKVGRCDRATLNKREVDKLTTCSGRLFHKWKTDIKN